MTMKDYIDEVQRVGGYETKAEAKKAILATFDSLTEILAKHDSVMIPGFGSYSVADVSEKSGKIPGTDKTYTKPAHKAPKFRFAKGVKDAVAK